MGGGNGEVTKSQPEPSPYPQKQTLAFPALGKALVLGWWGLAEEESPAQVPGPLAHLRGVQVCGHETRASQR